MIQAGSGTADYVSLFNQSIGGTFRAALRISCDSPSRAFFVLRTILRQNKAAGRRKLWMKRGVPVPPFMIASITERCNLRCHGCYAQAHQQSPESELSGEKLWGVIAEARDLGVSIVLIAGGEPLMRPEILGIIKEYPEIIFPIFTNGLLITDELADEFKRRQNLVPVISLEGRREATDTRRGQGVYELLLEKMALLKKKDVFFGASLTLTSQSYAATMSDEFITELMAKGSRLFFFIDYVPVRDGTDELCLTEAQMKMTPGIMASLRRRLPGLFISFPGDEEEFGSCLAAGRGFVHINPAGRIEPCPFSPFSDSSLKELSLREALQSKLLAAIRQNSHELQETRGGCALWSRRAWVEGLVKADGLRPSSLTTPEHSEPDIGEVE